MVTCSVNHADTDVFKQIAGEGGVQLNTADESAMAAFFHWVSQSFECSVLEDSNPEVSGMYDLPPPPDEIQIVT